MNKLGWMALSLIVMSGCKPADEPTEEDYDDVASAVSQLVTNDSGGEIGSMEDGLEIVGGASDLPHMGDGSYEGVFLGLTYAYEVECRDASGDVQSACDATTDSANLKVEWRGELDLPRYDASVDRTGDWTLSAIQSDLVAFDGHGTFDVDTEFTSWFGNRHRTFNLDYDANYDGVTWDRNAQTLSDGGIDYAVHAERTRSRGGRDVEATFDMDVHVAFDGSGVARITIDTEHEYTLDLQSGEVAKQ